MQNVLDRVAPMAKKRDDKSAKIDAWVLFMVETVVNWRKQTRPEDEKLTVAEYLSEMVRAGAGAEFKHAQEWLAKQSAQGPKTEDDSSAGKRKK
ncbi:unnamed protein product [Gemmataceae bacterium]|nr:unnamed protein product [Gemmataceae bacterium]VTT96518.1 unnamed protein product [Gemmataceae bacterium]